MSIVNFLKLKDKLEIRSFETHKDADRKNYIPFTGSPRKHPYEDTRVILIADPFNEVTYYYEFNMDDIVFVEELSNINNLSGDSVPMARVWVKKQSIALRCAPFIVDTLMKE